jgi:hypothetical protein
MKFEGVKPKDAVESSRKEVLEKGGNLNKSPVDLAMERAKLMEADAEVQQDDAEKIAEIGKSMGMDLSKSVAEKQKRADDIKQEIGKYFSEDESTMVKNYDKDGNEIPDKPQTLAEKNAEEMSKYFGKEESTTVKNYDKDGNEIPDKPQTLAEKNAEEMSKYFGKEESTTVKNYNKDGNEIPGDFANEKLKAKVKSEALKDFVDGLHEKGPESPMKTKLKKAWGWIKERLKGVATIGIYEFHQGERFRSETKKEAKQLKGVSKGMSENLRVRDLTEDEAFDEATRMKKMAEDEKKAWGGVEIKKEDLDKYSEIVTQEKIAVNDIHIEGIISGSTERLMSRLKKYKNEFGESVLTEEKIADFENKLRDTLKMLQSSVVENNPNKAALAGNEELIKKNIRESFDPKYWKRYVYGGLEVALAAIAVKYAAVKMAVGGVKSATMAHAPAAGPMAGPAPMPPTPTGVENIPMDHNVWSTAKAFAEKHLGAHLNNSEVLKLTQGMCGDNGVGVNVWNMTGNPMDTAMGQGHLLKVGKGFKAAMEAIAHARGL